MLSDKQVLLNYIRDTGKLQRIREQLQQPTERTYNGTIPDYNWAKQVLGEGTFQKIILATPGIEQLGTSPETAFTTLGGSCVMRTKCFHRLRAGLLTDLVTGEKIPIKSVQQVADWLENAISLDQIVDIVGPNKGTNYVIISEQRLWLRKIVSALSEVLGRKINNKEERILYEAIKKSEQEKHEMVKRYLNYVTNSEMSVVQVVDEDIHDDLKNCRDSFLESIQMSLDELVKMYQNISKKRYSSDICMQEYVYDVSLIETFYTGLYVNLLKKRAIIKTPKAIIIEPWTQMKGGHISSILNKKKAENNHIYLTAGIDKDVAFIAVDSATNSKLNSLPDIYTINRVPNKRKKLVLDSSIENFFNYFPYIKFADYEDSVISTFKGSSTKEENINKIVYDYLETLGQVVFK